MAFLVVGGWGVLVVGVVVLVAVEWLTAAWVRALVTVPRAGFEATVGGGR